MAHRRVEAEVEALEQLCASPGPAAAAALKKALADKVSLVAAKAAKLTASLQLRELIPDLLRAFDRLLEDGARRDPQCWGKNAIARALTELEYRESQVYLKAGRHVQLEAVWGGREDTAGPLRGICLLGLAAATDISRAETFRALVDGLTDSAHTVRLEAVRAVAQMEGEEAALLLRLKARAGDAEPRVIGQVFDGLLGLEGQAAFRFLAGFLEAGAGPVCEEAALALGASRHPAALSLLQEAWKAARDPDLRYLLLRSISASRQEEAIGFLIGIACNGRAPDVRDAMEALSLHQDSAELRRRVEAAVEEAGSLAQEQFRRCFARI